ncbi:hypothetical protein B0T17DRAFT_5069 [Bombardia bombarda]|uniref:Uncharacterized protein n=1 Tax=Bombardia bombarda TaxID=252184 RepID=A0AA40CDN5_9PEZI|nr:hypothetical protein B0T17DRAFT_5069 [Bombardia bombarda]
MTEACDVYHESRDQQSSRTSLGYSDTADRSPRYRHDRRRNTIVGRPSLQWAEKVFPRPTIGQVGFQRLGGRTAPSAHYPLSVALSTWTLDGRSREKRNKRCGARLRLLHLRRSRRHRVSPICRRRFSSRMYITNQTGLCRQSNICSTGRRAKLPLLRQEAVLSSVVRPSCQVQCHPSLWPYWMTHDGVRKRARLCHWIGRHKPGPIFAHFDASL